MMDSKTILEEYIRWIKNNITIENIRDNLKLIVTPFLDSHNDYIELYVLKQEDNKIKLTDGGDTLFNLRLEGIDIFSKKRKELLELNINRLGVNISEDNELYVVADKTNIGLKKHMLVQAILAISDMFYLTRQNVWGVFKDEIQSFLMERDIPFNSDVNIIGKSGLSFNIDFIIGRTRSKPEKLIKSINKIDTHKSRNVLFSFSDISVVRPDSKKIVIYNDKQKEASEDIKNAFKEYNTLLIPWSDKDRLLAELAV